MKKLLLLGLFVLLIVAIVCSTGAFRDLTHSNQNVRTEVSDTSVVVANGSTANDSAFMHRLVAQWESLNWDTVQTPLTVQDSLFMVDAVKTWQTFIGAPKGEGSLYQWADAYITKHQ